MVVVGLMRVAGLKRQAKLVSSCRTPRQRIKGQ